MKPIFHSAVEELVKHINERLAWGKVTDWTNKDFERLSEQIFTQTQKRLSVSTLKRVWGRAERISQPSHTTLDILAEFAGFQNWRHYLRQFESRAPATDFSPASSGISPRLWYAGIALLGMGALLTIFWMGKPGSAPQLASYPMEAFTFQQTIVGEEIPNSVVFTYDASSAAPDALVEIQQSWDDRKRRAISREDSIATCIYFRPGFFQTKLVIDSQIVAEEGVLIPTKDWLGLVEQDPVPIYLPDEEVNQGKDIMISPEALKTYDIDPLKEDVIVSLYKVADFGDLYTDAFTLEMEIKNAQVNPRRRCQGTHIYLLFEGGAVSVPLANEGCVASLNMMTFDGFIDGSTHDLSGFGVDMGQYQALRMHAEQGILHIFLNGEEVYQMPVSEPAMAIKGVSIHFEGAGAIRNIVFRNTEQVLYASP